MNASTIAVIASLVGILCSLTALVTFIVNMNKRAQEDGAYRQKQEDATHAIDVKVDAGFKNTNEKIDALTDVVEEVQREQKNANARMIRICTYHRVNHPGQDVEV